MVGFYPANFGFPRPFRSRVRSRHATDRQIVRHRPSFHNAPPYGRGLEIIMMMIIIIIIIIIMIT